MTMPFVVEIVLEIYSQFPHLQHHVNQALNVRFYDDFVRASVTQAEVTKAVASLRTAKPRDFPLNTSHIIAAVRKARDDEKARADAAVKQTLGQRESFAARLERWEKESARVTDETRRRQIAEARRRYPHIYR